MKHWRFKALISSTDIFGWAARLFRILNVFGPPCNSEKAALEISTTPSTYPGNSLNSFPGKCPSHSKSPNRALNSWLAKILPTISRTPEVIKYLCTASARSSATRASAAFFVDSLIFAFALVCSSTLQTNSIYLLATSATLPISSFSLLASSFLSHCSSARSIAVSYSLVANCSSNSATRPTLSFISSRQLCHLLIFSARPL